MAYSPAKRQKHRSQGLCVECTKQALDGHSRCAHCVASRTAAKRRKALPTRSSEHVRAARRGFDGGYSKQMPEYRSWKSMRDRCYRPKHRSFHSYGGRGIGVCERWRNSFLAFYEDMGPRPPGMSIDRINCDGNYEPGNCRWATAKEQAANRKLPQRAALRGGR